MVSPAVFSSSGHAWLLYRKQENGSKSKLTALHEFKTRIAITLCTGTEEETKRGRPSGVSAHKNRKLPDNPEKTGWQFTQEATHSSPTATRTAGWRYPSLSKIDQWKTALQDGRLLWFFESCMHQMWHTPMFFLQKRSLQTVPCHLISFSSVACGVRLRVIMDTSCICPQNLSHDCYVCAFYFNKINAIITV